MEDKYKFFPSDCPICNNPLIIEYGKDKKKKVIKLMCKNRECPGTAIKRLTKGILELKIREVGPSTIECLYNAGMRNSYDVFDRINFSEEVLVKSNQFKEGRALQKILDSIASTTEISIENAIASMQIDDIGTTFSLQIGKMLSGMPYDFSGLNLNIREDMKKDNSDILNLIKNGLLKFESCGVKIKYLEKRKEFVASKTINKKICFSVEAEEGMEDALKLRGITIVDWDGEPDIVVVQSKGGDDETRASEIGAKVMTIQQLKLIYL